ncbi:MAG: phosphoribulokinase [Alkalinema sp. CACIAM 70d]|nr:MAG: phosphoribulokinase [Alkalinema sp. CACIAM 70d]
MRKMVADVMTRNPITAHPTTPLKQVILTMAENRISGIPVVDDSGKLVGIVSETDLMWQETGVTPPPYVMILDSIIYLKNPATYERDLHRALGVTVAEVMTSHPIVIQESQSVADAARLMHDRHIHRLPVVDSTGRLAGILTQGDILRTMAQELAVTPVA